jgi:hypothetical protein
MGLARGMKSFKNGTTYLWDAISTILAIHYELAQHDHLLADDCVALLS